MKPARRVAESDTLFLFVVVGSSGFHSLMRERFYASLCHLMTEISNRQNQLPAKQQEYIPIWLASTEEARIPWHMCQDSKVIK